MEPGVVDRLAVPDPTQWKPSLEKIPGTSAIHPRTIKTHSCVYFNRMRLKFFCIFGGLLATANRREDAPCDSETHGGDGDPLDLEIAHHAQQRSILFAHEIFATYLRRPAR